MTAPHTPPPAPAPSPAREPVTAAVAPLVITGCGVVSPAGHGLAGLTAAAGPPPADLDAISGDFPPVPLAAAPDLRVQETLGSKGTRSLDRTTRLALVAAHHALAGLGTPLGEQERARTGVVIGSSTGSVRSSSEFSRETLVRDKPYLVRANRFPSAVMNFCAGQLAIWNSLRGVNATIAGGRVSGLAAVRYARNAIARGRADRVLAGAVEELCAESAWAWHHSRALAPGAAIGEGAAVFLVETPGGAAAARRAPLAELLACEVATPGAGGMRDALARCVDRALRRSGLGAADVGTVALGAAGIRGLRAAERDAVRTVLGPPPAGGPGPRTIRPAAWIGESYSASGALQIAALLADWHGPDTGAASRAAAGAPAAIVTSLGEDGHAGCLVMRRPQPASTGH